MQRSFTFKPLTREGTNFLKGISILLIALHNYYRWISPATGENEFEFSRLATIKSYAYIGDNPYELIHVLFNFLGHYGVQAFIVISAYGLTLSYKKNRPSYGRYLLHRIDKLYPALWFAVIVFILFSIIMTRQMISGDVLGEIGIQLTLFANLVPGKAMSVCGPWWFWSFIFGFYLVFPGIIWIYEKAGIKGLLGVVVVGYLFTIFGYAPLRSLNMNPYFLFAGHLPELCLGIFLAERNETRFPWWIVLLSFLAFTFGNWFEWLWPFANTGVAVLLVIFLGWMARTLDREKIFYRVISFIGVVSIYIFALQGFVRNPFLGLSSGYDSVFFSLVSGLLFLFVVTGLAWLMFSVEHATRKWIGSYPEPKEKMKRFVLLFLSVILPFVLLSIAPGNKGAMQVPDKGKMIFSVMDDFEKPNPQYGFRYNDSIYSSGHSSFEMTANDSYSPVLELDLKKTGLKDISRAESSVMLFTADSLAVCHLIFEVWDILTNTRLESVEKKLRGKEFTRNHWIAFSFEYPIPTEYLHSNIRFKTLLWSTGKGKFYADDLKLAVYAMK
jgi:peptidoglycan/LPS O-acetylase OafA/YrhL